LEDLRLTLLHRTSNSKSMDTKVTLYSISRIFHMVSFIGSFKTIFYFSSFQTLRSVTSSTVTRGGLLHELVQIAPSSSTCWTVRRGLWQLDEFSMYLKLWWSRSRMLLSRKSRLQLMQDQDPSQRRPKSCNVNVINFGRPKTKTLNFILWYDLRSW
jgi:hypothetical protein